MKLGLVGHQRTICIIEKIIAQSFPDIDVTEIPMDTMDFQPAVSYIKANENRFDGVLFTGKIPYDLANTSIISQKPWMYIQHNTARLLGGLLEAAAVYGYDIHKISIDSYQEEEVFRVYEDLKIPKEKLNIRIPQCTIFDDEFIENTCRFHRESYECDTLSVCITGISSVYEYLTGLRIPCIALDPTRQSVEDAIGYYDSKKKFKLEKNSDIVVLAVERDLPDEHALIKENEYQLSLESMKISEEIYLFSQRVQAAVVEREIGKYLLFTTKYLFEIETEQLQKINILTQQNVRRFGTLSIGIGYGQTAREAKYNANLGLLKAKKQSGNQAYKVEGGQFFGPIVPTCADKSPVNQINGHFQMIATTTGISLNGILKLQEIMDRNKTNTFTPLELADMYGISPRSMNRLLEKLLDSKYAKIIGCNMRATVGRPSRIIQINFT